MYNASPNRKRGKGLTPDDLLKDAAVKSPSEHKALTLTQMIGGRINDSAIEKIRKASERVSPAGAVDMSPKERIRQLRQQMKPKTS